METLFGPLEPRKRHRTDPNQYEFHLVSKRKTKVYCGLLWFTSDLDYRIRLVNIDGILIEKKKEKK